LSPNASFIDSSESNIALSTWQTVYDNLSMPGLFELASHSTSKAGHKAWTRVYTILHLSLLLTRGEALSAASSLRPLNSRDEMVASRIDF
jgi:hypothetical protein